MNQLKIDHHNLSNLGIKKPSTITPELKSEYSQEVQNLITRYKHLLLNKIFMKKNGIGFNEISTPLTNGAKNGKKHIIDKMRISGIIDEIISYPIHQIYIYIIENLDYLKGNNLGQLEVAKRFNIKNLGILRKIIKGLGLENELNWNYINLTIEKFENLIKEVEKLEMQKDNIEAIDFINIGKNLGITNPQNLHTGLSAINVTKKYKLPKLRLSSIDDTLKIKENIETNYSKGRIITSNQINEITEKNIDLLPKSNRDNKEKIIKSILKFFGYNYL